MPHAPKEGLAARHALDAQPNRNAEHMSCVQQRSNDAVAALDAGAGCDGITDARWVSRLERSIRPKM